MCGIVGVAGDLAYKDEATFKRLLFFDYLRGIDATGMASIRNNGDVHIAKLAMDPITLFHDKRFDTALSGNQSKVLLGHNRAATRGEKNNFNAHPFEYDHIVGAHNGTLDATSWSALEAKLGEKFAVDSQALIAAIAKLGVKDAIEMCTEGRDSQTGAWSLVWYDSNEGTLNFLRNCHRPMWLAYEKDFKRLFWASEWWMIDAAIRSTASNPVGNGTPIYELHSDPVEGWRFFPTDADVHYKFDVGLMIQQGGTGANKPKPKIQTIKGKEPPKVVTTVVDDPFGRHGGNICGITIPKRASGKTTTSLGTTRQSTPDPVVHWLGKPAEPLAGYLDEDAFNEMAKYGCAWCSADVDIHDVGITVYERTKEVLCASCSGNKPEGRTTRIYAEPLNFAMIAPGRN